MNKRTRTITTVAVTAGSKTHKAWTVKDSDKERAFNPTSALCGSDIGRPGSRQADRQTDAEVTCAKCLKRTDEVGASWTIEMEA